MIQSFGMDLGKTILKNPEHNLEQWNKLTSKVPEEYMEQGQSKTSKTASKGSFVMSLRNGLNPNLTPKTTPSAQRQTTVNQTNMQQFLNKKALGMG